jgi:hypothetical protein
MTPQVGVYDMLGLIHSIDTTVANVRGILGTSFLSVDFLYISAQTSNARNQNFPFIILISIS